MIFVLSTLAILVVAVAVFGTAFVGQRGRGKEHLPPRIAERLQRAARHLNGEAEPPAAFTRVIERSTTLVAERRRDREPTIAS